MFTAKEASDVAAHAFDEVSPIIERIEKKIRLDALEGQYSTIVHFPSICGYSPDQINRIRAVLNRNGYLTEYDKERECIDISW